MGMHCISNTWQMIHRLLIDVKPRHVEPLYSVVFCEWFVFMESGCQKKSFDMLMSGFCFLEERAREHYSAVHD